MSRRTAVGWASVSLQGQDITFRSAVARQAKTSGAPGQCRRRPRRLRSSHQRTEAPMPILDLEVITGDSSDIQSLKGYRRVEQDLNQGAGGKYIYLCYCEGYTVGPFVTDIT